MSEPFDVEISRALKRSAADSLHNLEFTREMQQKVLTRIRAEEGAAPAPQPGPSRRSRTAPFLKPVAWTAVAAAALVLALNMDLGGFGGSTGNVERGAADSGASAAQTESSNADVMATGSSPAPVPAPAGDPEVKIQSPPEEQPAVSDQRSQFAGASVQPDTMALRASLVTELTLPPAEELADVAPAGKMAPKAPEAAFTLTVVEQKVALSVNGAQAPVIELNTSGVRAVNEAGLPVWERSLEGATPEGVLAVGTDGRIAASAGTKVTVLKADGEIERTFDAGGLVTAMTWSADGRLAVSTGNSVVVYKGDAAQMTFDGVTNPEIAFGPDGSLALYDPGTLALYSMDGAKIFRGMPASQGRGLAFLANGQVLLAGNQAYDRSGKALWHAPMATEGLAVPDSESLVVTWDGHMVLGLNPLDGAELWRAFLPGEGGGLKRAELSADGQHLVLVGHAGEGAGLWVLDRGGNLLYSRRWPEMPISASIAGGNWVLLLPGGLVIEPL